MHAEDRTRAKHASAQDIDLCYSDVCLEAQEHDHECMLMPAAVVEPSCASISVSTQVISLLCSNRYGAHVLSNHSPDLVTCQ